MVEVMDYDLLRLATPRLGKTPEYKKIYVASPLSALSWLDMHKNMEAARYYEGIVGRIFGCRALATHAHLPLLFHDDIPEEREIALDIGLRLLATCDALIICGKRITSGMAGEIRKAIELGLPILFLEDYT